MGYIRPPFLVYCLSEFKKGQSIGIAIFGINEGRFILQPIFIPFKIRDGGQTGLDIVVFFEL
ncbi:MAG: hypothetical protein VSS75_018180 [Candidatus Parabeggiatoa sp.]|nr:hypothetical protein [Candidatus Parabeggiatoa sp.]